MSFWHKVYEARRCLGSLVLAQATGGLSRQVFANSLMGVTRTTCMISFIFVGAAFLTIAMGFTGIPRALAQWIGAMDLERYGLIAALTVFFINLGCFLDGISVVLLSTSIIMPMVQAAGIDRCGSGSISSWWSRCPSHPAGRL